MDKKIIINNKVLEIPSFFWICNLGGGASDKYRENVYEDLYVDFPILLNYYYINYNNYSKFATKWIRHIQDYNDIASFLEYVRVDMATKEKYMLKDYRFKNIDLHKKVYLLDSGAKNIINNVLTFNSSETTLEQAVKILEQEMIKYYDFANKYKFDLVVGFDTGGKYTSKGNERNNEEIIKRNNLINEHFEYINYCLAEATAKYIKDNPEFYPKILITIHGKTPNEYEKYVKKIIDIEKKYSISFFGFALGGVASSKGIDESWFNGIKVEKDSKNPILTSRASSIVSKYAGGRPIHVLGGGSYLNIPLNFYNGATSFDSQTPGRRAYDGNQDSVHRIFDSNYNGSISKYLPGIFDSKGMEINSNINPKYTKLNKIEKIQMCGCKSCEIAINLNNIKKLYATKDKDRESYYFSRQLINAHAIWQHKYICQKVARFDCLLDFMNSLSNTEYKRIMQSIIEESKKIKHNVI